MAASISNILIAFPKTQQEPRFPSINCTKFPSAPILSLTQNSLSIRFRKPSTSCKALSETNSSFSPTSKELHREQEQKPKPEPEPEREREQESEAQKRIADVWREIHGEDDWRDLLDPIMDPLLRSELIRYGEMAQACYDAFDYDPYSQNCGSSRFTRHIFFESLGLTRLGYNFRRNLYATANVNLPKFFKRSRWPRKMWSKHANWMGYIAVSDDATSELLGRRDIAIAWRGTVTHTEWVADLTDILKPVSSFNIPCLDDAVKVESGFLHVYTDKEGSCGYAKKPARAILQNEVKRLVTEHSNEEMSITITGHSLGSALAILSAFDIAETGLNVLNNMARVPISVFSFSGPRVGNLRFKKRLESLGVKVLRVVNKHDVVPKSPGFVINEHVPSMMLNWTGDFPWSYVHVGKILELNHETSPFLDRTRVTAASAHNLEALLHLLDGYHGEGQPFVLANRRDHALVNKGCDFLLDKYLVPPNWRQDENKGLIMNKDGRWVQPERPKPDPHLEDINSSPSQATRFGFR